MTFLLILLILVGSWSLAAGKNISTIKNYGLNRAVWMLPAVVIAPCTYLALFVMVRASDDLKEKRKLIQFENKLKNAKEEELQMNRLLE